MNFLLGHVKLNRGKIWLPNEVKKELRAVDGDKLIFTKTEHGIIVTKNEVHNAG
jgi:bifunctional DNA-binding transcriptional regulator/antitoxin component of YhaV-PrlF toxin-antitoxin module